MVELHRDRPAQGPLIRGFAGRGFRVDDRVHDGGLLLTPEAALDWRPPTLDDLDLSTLDRAVRLSPPPEFLLLGTGATMRAPPRTFAAALDALGIGIEPMDSRAAARAWGLLRGEGRWIAAALYPLD